MKWLRRSIWLVVFVALGIGALSLYYVLPRHDVVMITGVEVKRMDADGVINAENPADGPTRDVYFINTEDPDSKKVVVYRNEDTGWSFRGTSNSTPPTFRPKPKATRVTPSNWL